MDFLLKVGRAKYIQDMFDNEYLFFNTFSSFKSNEKDPCGRNDPREANTSNRQMTSLEITTSKGKIVKLSEISNEFNAQFHEHPTNIPYNICSLFTLTFDKNLNYKKIDDKVLCLGNKTLFIHNIGRFFEILDNSIESQNIVFSRKPVIYYNYKTHDGELTFYHIEDSYNYQKEYRIILETPGTNIINVKLPGLKEISTIYETDNINDLQLSKI